MGTDKKKKREKTLAEQADKYVLYEAAVQSPDVDASFFRKVFRKRFSRDPRILREDFCGTAAVCCQWARSGRDRLAIGVDLDPVPLAWARQHNLAALPRKVRERVQLVQGDVREVEGPAADVVAAQNFSFFIFKTRDEMRGYFEAARRHLAEEGLLILDMMGGSQSHIEDHVEKRKVGKGKVAGISHPAFQYLWEQRRFDPITHRSKNHIHFRFRDGSRLRRAFSYDWRLWTLPEVQEVLVEAGFDEVQVYWEGTDSKTGEGNGRYRPRRHAPADPAWIAYVVAARTR